MPIKQEQMTLVSMSSTQDLGLFIRIFYFLFLALNFTSFSYGSENRPFEEVIFEKYAKCQLIKENIFISPEQEKIIKQELGFKFSS
jgi:hypothetical protein